MAKPARIKQTAPVFAVPQTKDDVVAAIARIGEAQRERQRIEADMNDALAKLRQQYEQQAAPYALEIEQLSRGIQVWCDAHRAELTDNGRVKFARLASGEISWRTRPPKVTVRSIDAVLQSLKALGLNKFVRTKEEINKEAMLAEPEIAGSIQGVKIEQGEDFIVKPFETELEAVA